MDYRPVSWLPVAWRHCPAAQRHCTSPRVLHCCSKKLPGNACGTWRICLRELSILLYHSADHREPHTEQPRVCSVQRNHDNTGMLKSC